MSLLNQSEERALMSELAATVARYAPNWTTDNSSDPGITMVDLFTWLGEQVRPRLDSVSELKQTQVRSIIEKILLALSGGCDTSAGMTRPRYYTGQLLTAADLETEQNYFREKLRRHNRCILGCGIVSGLDVSLDASNSAVIVSPGCAITESGEEIHVIEPLSCSLTTLTAAGFVSLTFCESYVPLGGGEFQGSSRVQEGVSSQFGESAPVGSVVVAHVEYERGQWILDTRFHSKRARLAYP